MVCINIERDKVVLSVVLLLAGTAACCTGASSALKPLASDAYTAHNVRIPNYKSSCIDGTVYTPKSPCSQPPGAVIMFPALGQHASLRGLQSYAHSFASSGLTVILLSAPGAAASGSATLEANQDAIGPSPQQQQQQQQHNDLSPTCSTEKPANLFGKGYLTAAAAYIKQLAKQNIIDGSRIALWGAEWGAVAATQAAVELQGLEVQTLLLQTPLLTATPKHTWQRLEACGWGHNLKSLAAAAADWLLQLLRMPVAVRPAGIPLSGPPGSGVFLELQQHELELHRMAVGWGPESEEAQSLHRSSLLALLVNGNPIHKLLPELKIPIAFYAAAGDSDTSLQQYVAASKTAKYVSFHVSAGSRYNLLAGRTDDQQAIDEVIQDETMLLIALLGDVELIKFDAAAEELLESGGGGDSPTSSQQQQLQSLSEPAIMTVAAASVEQGQKSDVVSACPVGQQLENTDRACHLANMSDL